MKERPIPFNGEMTRAIIEGRKTMTRRIVKPQPERDFICMPDGQLPGICKDGSWINCRSTPKRGWMACPYGQPGDRLWVRETWAYDVNAQAANSEEEGPFVYAADGERAAMCRIDGKWHPSIFMPRWASRILLEITAVRVERLQDISEDDAKAEGMSDDYIRANFPPSECFRKPTAREAFRALWDSINVKRGYGWDVNPWVWVVEFKRVEA